MTLSPLTRLWLYVAMAVLPEFRDFFKNSSDYSARGLLVPICAALYSAVIVVLAKTAPTNGDDEPQKVNVVNPPGHPVPTKEQPKIDKPAGKA